jgi:hypothetical protein
VTDSPEEPPRSRASRQSKPAPQPAPLPSAPIPQRNNNNVKAPYRLSQQVVNAVAIVVTAVWGVSFIADILVPDYTPPTNVHMALMVVLGGVFGSQFVRRI